MNISKLEWRDGIPVVSPCFVATGTGYGQGMIQTLVQATKALVVLNTLSSNIPNMKLFVSMYVRKEALFSSQIEGTQATLEDVLDPLIEIVIEKR